MAWSARIVVLIVVIAAVALILVRGNDSPTTNPDPDSSVDEMLDQPLSEPHIDVSPGSETPFVSFGITEPDAEEVYEWPSNIENLIWEYFAHRQKSNIISINSVECTETTCTIEFVGTEINPQYTDEFSDLWNDMSNEHWNIWQGGIGTREIAPGARVFVISISNVPVDIDQLRREGNEPQ